MIKETIKNSPEIKFLGVAGVIILFMLISSHTFGTDTEKEAVASAALSSASFPEVEITGKSAYVYDSRTKEVLYAKNENARLPLASVTKVMAALVASELAPAYTAVAIDSEALKLIGDSGLYAGERWGLKDLLDFSLITSSNDGMRAAALALGALSDSEPAPEEAIADFIAKMNIKASELGLLNTYYWNETGLDESEVKGGAYGTAKDMAMLFDYILEYHPELLEATRQKSASFVSLDGHEHLAQNTNAITGQIPKIIASKTGFTDIAGGNLVVAFDPELGRPIIISVLGSTTDGRFEDVKVLAQAVMQYITGQ